MFYQTDMIKNNLSSFSKKYLKYNLILIVLISLGKIISFSWKTLLLRENIELVGEIEVLLTTLGLFTALASLAFPAAFARFSLRNRTKIKAYGKFSFIQTSKSFVFLNILILLVSLAFISFYQKIFIVPFLIFSFLLLGSVIQEFFLVFLNIEKRFISYGISKFLLQPLIRIILLTLIIVKLIPKTMIFNHVVWAVIFTTIITGSLLIKKNYFKKQASLLLREEKSRFLSYSFSLSGSLISFIAYGAVDIYLLQYFLGNFSVGIYSAIFMGVNALELIFSPFLQTFQVHLAEKKLEKEKQSFTKKTSVSLLLSGVAVGLIVVATLPMFLTYVLSIKNIYFFSILLFVITKIIHSSIVLISRHYLDFEGEEKLTLKTMNITLLLKIVLGVVLIPKFGILGLAISQFVAEIIHVLLLRKRVSFILNS